MNGLLKTRKLNKRILIHGSVIMLALVFIQLLLDGFQPSFMLYMPPLGFVFFLLVSYGIQPIVVGALNIAILHRLYNLDGWQIGFWLNGLFLLLTFSTINIILQTIIGFAFSSYITIAEMLILPYPFGYLGKFSNRGSKRTCPQQIPVAQSTSS